MRFIQRIRMPGLLSFPPDMDFFDLQSLNVLIGPNASGKSNFIETLELLRATPSDFAAAVRDGGGAGEWLWKGRDPREPAEIATVLGEGTPTGRPLTHRLTFTDVKSRVEVVDEAIEELEPRPGKSDVFFYYRFQRGHPAINIRNRLGRNTERGLQRDSLDPDQSVLAQRKDPDLYPEVTWVGRSYGAIQTFSRMDFRSVRAASSGAVNWLP